MTGVNIHRTQPNITPRKLMESYEDWMVERIQGGWDGYLLTFMFKPLAGNEKAVAAQMEKEVHVTYRKILHHAINDARKTPLDQFPLWIGSPDWPVPKRVRTTVGNLGANGGRHVHVVALMPPNTKMKVDLDEHIGAQQAKLADGQSKIVRIHAVRIDKTPRKAANYVFKAFSRHRIGDGDLIVLPKADSEMAKQSPN